jgi:DAK2 domain fusion protein YloV
MPAVQDIDGAVVRLWLRLAADELDRARPAIDVLNVFPVADSDTGTNMARTISCAADALAVLPEQATVAEIWQAAAAAALEGACGNSGIILSQLLCGLADTCGPATPCDGQVVALALTKAAALARAAVHRPVEGTVLTVADAAARAAVRAAEFADLPAVGRAAALGARDALLATRTELEVLAASGVVDAGGAGLCVLLAALSAVISGDDDGSFAIPAPIGHLAVPAGPSSSEFGYEVTFLLEAPAHAASALRDRLDLLGDSLVVSGREPRWHVHVHVADAGAAVEAGLAAGQLSKITVTYLKSAHPSGAEAVRSQAVSGVVAIAGGAGVASLLRAAGATVIDGAECADPGAAIDDVVRSSARAVLVTTGGRLADRWPRGWPVLAVGSEVQLLAALAVHDPRLDEDADLASMQRAVAGMRWASVRGQSQSERGAALPASPGPTEQFIGAVGGHDVLTGRDQEGVSLGVTELLLQNSPELFTLLIGRGASPGLASLVTEHIAGADRPVEVVCYDGGMTSSLLQIGAE